MWSGEETGVMDQGDKVWNYCQARVQVLVLVHLQFQSPKLKKGPELQKLKKGLELHLQFQSLKLKNGPELTL